MGSRIEYLTPDRFTCGTVGQPGERTFYLQARAGSRLTSVVCEKQQVSVLADNLSRILDEITRLSGGSLVVPPARSQPQDRDPLDVPLLEQFRVGTMTIAWDALADRVQIELFELDTTEAEEEEEEVETGDDAEDDRDVLVVSLTPTMARDFAARARMVVGAGRPACPFCGQPIDPQGHICPRSNGFRKPLV